MRVDGIPELREGKPGMLRADEASRRFEACWVEGREKFGRPVVVPRTLDCLALAGALTRVFKRLACQRPTLASLRSLALWAHE